MSNILARAYDDAVAITTSDTTPQAKTSPFAGLLVTVTGNVSLITAKGTAISLAAVPAYTEIHIATQWVKATGTTATVLGLIAQPHKGQP